jgi:flagellar hook assembly protein FlgD
MDKGNHSLVWKGTDDNDKPVASGVYLYRLSSGKAQTSRKMVLLK